jgi:hypothetical protein
MNNDTQKELEKLRAEHEQLLKDLKILRSNFFSDFTNPVRVNPELSWEAVPSSIENIAFVAFAGEAELNAKTEEEKVKAFLARQIAVYIHTQQRISEAMWYLLGTFTGSSGKDIPRTTHLNNENYGKTLTSRLGLKIDTRRNKEEKSPYAPSSPSKP